MTDEHRRLLTKVKPKLIEHLKPFPVLAELEANVCLQKIELQTIKSRFTACEQSDCLLDILRTCPDIAFYKFKDALEETGQYHLAKLLDEIEEPPADRHRFLLYEHMSKQLEIGSSSARGM